ESIQMNSVVIIPQSARKQNIQRDENCKVNTMKEDCYGLYSRWNHENGDLCYQNIRNVAAFDMAWIEVLEQMR
ncbi:hypothetical protein HHI36_008802, partial [Cryptolaemus montrouzieri]